MRHFFPLDIDIGILRNQRSEIERRRQVCVRIKSFRDVSFLFHVGKLGRRFVEADGNFFKHLVAVHISNVQIGRLNFECRGDCIRRNCIIVPAAFEIAVRRIVGINFLSPYGDIGRSLRIRRAEFERDGEALKRPIAFAAFVFAGGENAAIRLLCGKSSKRSVISLPDIRINIGFHSRKFARRGHFQLKLRKISRDFHRNVKFLGHTGVIPKLRIETAQRGQISVRVHIVGFSSKHMMSIHDNVQQIARIIRSVGRIAVGTADRFAADFRH